jgi:hypothetical protein
MLIRALLIGDACLIFVNMFILFLLKLDSFSFCLLMQLLFSVG